MEHTQTPLASSHHDFLPDVYTTTSLANGNPNENLPQENPVSLALDVWFM